MPLYYCGFNGFGQKYDSTAVKIISFSLFPIDNVTDVVFSWSYLVFRTSNNDIFVSGLLQNSSRTLKKLEFPEGTNILKMSCSSFRCHILFISSSGTCFMYNGLNVKELTKFTSTEKNDSDDLSNDLLVQVSCGEKTNLALSSTGILYNIPSPISITPKVKVVHVACGFEHNLLLTEMGTVFSWGIGSRGQLGHGQLDDVDAPRELSTLSGNSISRIAAGGWHSAVIDDLGELWSWGWNNEGQLGFPSTKTSKDNKDSDELDFVNVSASPITVPFGDKFHGKIVDISCGNRHTMALSDDGLVWGCGWNQYGQLGKPKTLTNVYKMTRLDSPNGRATSILCGAWSSAILVDS